jgi:TetR/AcrR family transcriptional regulator, cholesterol catabolism regulator
MELKNKIIEKAADLFFRYGIKRITMDDISRELGISKKTLYASFTDKDQIVDVLTDKALQENIEQMESICCGAKDPVHEVVSAAKYMSSVFTRINPVFFYDLKRYYPAAWNRFQQFKEKHMMRILVQNLKKGIEMKIYRGDLDVNMMARYRIAQFDMALDPTVFPPEKFSLAVTHVFLLDHFLHGITTIKGHRLINKYNEVKEEE